MIAYFVKYQFFQFSGTPPTNGNVDKILNLHFLRNGEITCVANEGSSIVDYMLASSALFDSFSNFQVARDDFSDHFPLHCRLLLSHDNQIDQTFELDSNTNTWVKYKWKEESKNQFMRTFSLLFSNFKDTVNETNNSMINSLPDFINIYKKAGTCMKVKHKKAKSIINQPPWWDNECNMAKLNKYSLLRKFRRTDGRMDLHNYKAAKARLKNLCRSKRLLFEKEKRTELANACKNPREYWRKIKQNCNKKSSQNHITADNWLTYFRNLLNMNVETANDDLLQNITQEHDSHDLERPISDDEIISSVKSMHANRSPGPDGICIEMLKYTLNEITPFLNILFNEIYDKGELPANWCENIICPIHKSGPQTDPANFRGISLINSISKVFTGILTTRLQTWAEENSVLDESQVGFRKRYSTIDNLFSLHAIIQKYLCRPRGRFFCIFIDFRRAFDSIPHSKIWDSLKRKGINENGKFLKIFHSMYSQLKSCIKVNNSLTHFFECTIGTRQGCVSSPIIFSLFINDLVDYIRSESDSGIFITNDVEDLFALMFADDVSCFSDTVVRLQRLINLIEKFCNAVGMKLNLDKTKIMVFRNGGIVKHIEKWFFQGTEIEIVSLYKYLGLYFTPKLIWTKTKEILSMQAKKAATSIFRYQKYFGRFQPNDAFKLFDSMVKPVACYGAEIWGYQFCEEIEKVQSRFCKYFIGLKQSTNDSFALGECGRLPLAVCYTTRALKYWLKLTQMPNNRYPRQCYNMLKSLTDAGKITWATHIRSLLFENGFGHAWIEGSVGNANAFIALYIRRIKDISLQNWHRIVHDSPKAYHYRHFKSQLDVEKYLSIDLSFIGRKTLANFRCSSHNLQIEKGRHQNIEREYRFCPFCIERSVYTIEDELHFFYALPDV